MPAARERAPRRPRHHLPRRARPGEDAHDPLAHRAARRVDADRRRQRDQRRPVRARSRSTRAMLVAERGDDTPIEWVHRERRFGEKLATPDTSIADLIGEVDPIKVAEGRYLSDELTIHYGLVPRTNRGIFAINELPDLAERIQVGLLNVLEERDVQIRGYKIRLPLDVMLVASANPEDYTNRGRIITPLKDRFGAQIRTHYPLDAELEIAIIEQEARPLDADGLNVHGARLHERDRRRDQPAGPPLAARQPALRRVGPARRSRTTRPWSPTRTRRVAAPRRDRGRAARQRPRRARRVAPRARSRSRPSTTAARSRCSSASCKARCSRCSAPACRPRSSPTSCTRSRAARWCTPARTSRRRSTPSSSTDLPALAATLADLEVGETPGRGGVGHRVRARGAAPLQAAQQGRGRRPRRLPWPRLNRCRSDPAAAVLVLLVELAALGGATVDVLDRVSGSSGCRPPTCRRRPTSLHRVEIGLRRRRRCPWVRASPARATSADLHRGSCR